MSNYKNGLKFGLGLLTAGVIGFVLFAGLALGMDYIDEKNRTYTNETGIKLESENHWLTEDSLIFSGTVSYDGKLKWRYIDLSFRVIDINGKFSDICKETLYKPMFKDNATMKFKAKCYDIPKDLVFKSYEFETSGVY